MGKMRIDDVKAVYCHEQGHHSIRYQDSHGNKLKALQLDRYYDAVGQTPFACHFWCLLTSRTASRCGSRQFPEALTVKVVAGLT